MSEVLKEYSRRRNTFIRFCDADGNNQVKFLCFLNSLDISMDLKRDEIQNPQNNLAVYTDAGVSYSYKVSFDIPFYKSSDSAKGKKDIDTLIKICRPTAERRANEPFARGVKVLLANLINNGRGSTSVKNHGLNCIIQNINVEHNADFGFFDRKTFRAKVYSISLDLEVIVTNAYPGENNTLVQEDICRGFNALGEYDPQDVKTWPFLMKEGYSESRHLSTINNEFEKLFINKKNAKISFQYPRKKLDQGKVRKTTFPSFIENFSETNTYEYKTRNLGINVYTPEEIKEVGYKFTINVPANSRQQSVYNMRAAQILFRILAPARNTNGISKVTTVKFRNLIDNEDLYIDGITLKIDTDMGFFELYNKFYIKNYTIDFSTKKSVKVEEGYEEQPENQVIQEAPTPQGGDIWDNL